MHQIAQNRRFAPSNTSLLVLGSFIRKRKGTQGLCDRTGKAEKIKKLCLRGLRTDRKAEAGRTCGNRKPGFESEVDYQLLAVGAKAGCLTPSSLSFLSVK